MRDIMKMSDQDLYNVYSEALKSSEPGVQMYAEEIGRRGSEKTNRTLVRLTWGVVVMTGCVVVLAIVQLAVILFSKAPAV
jgi:hypothetical protein